MNEVYTSELNVIINIVLGLILIIGGFVFSKCSKSSEQMKRNVSIGAYALGILALIFHLPNFWRVINRTYEPTQINLPEIAAQGTPDLSNMAYTSTQVVELFGMSINFFHLINVGIGIGIVIIGLMFKEKNWSKYAMLLGVAAMVSGAFQILL